jgi:hypothetical protein
MRDFRLLGEVDENCTLLSNYRASSGNFLPTFQESLPVPSTKDGTNRLSWNISKKLTLLGA